VYLGESPGLINLTTMNYVGVYKLPAFDSPDWGKPILLHFYLELNIVKL